MRFACYTVCKCNYLRGSLIDCDAFRHQWHWLHLDSSYGAFRIVKPDICVNIRVAKLLGSSRSNACIKSSFKRTHGRHWYTQDFLLNKRCRKMMLICSDTMFSALNSKHIVSCHILWCQWRKLVKKICNVTRKSTICLIFSQLHVIAWHLHS